MSAEKHIPLRQCLGCSEHFPKAEMTRIVRQPDGEIAVDPTGKAPGRGAYYCGNPKCLQKIRKNGRLNQTFKSQISESVFEDIVSSNSSK